MIFEKIKELEGQINYLNEVDKNVITKAINFSKDAHFNQIRQSGDPFVTHPIEVAKILTSIKFVPSGFVAVITLFPSIKFSFIHNPFLLNETKCSMSRAYWDFVFS